MTRVRCLLAAVLLALCACGGGSGGPNVVLVILDTVRADHLGCYGCNRQTSPVLDSLAAAGTLFARCQAQSSWTLPSVASIFTGLPPRATGAGFRGGAFYGLDPALETIPTILHSGGYRTSAILNVVFLSEDFGFHRGFDSFDCRGFAGEGSERLADGTTVDALSWLDSAGEGRFFLLVHYYDAHMRYDPPAPYADLFTDPSYSGPYDSAWGGVPHLVAVNSGEEVIPGDGLRNLEALYDGEIAFVDASLGELLSGIRERGLGGETVVIVVADHGEEFMEHGGIEHGLSLYQEITHVPLVISGPGVPAGRVDSALCSQLDVLPTVAALSGLAAPEGLPGRDLLAGGESRMVPASGVLWSMEDMTSIVDGTGKAIWAPGSGATEGYDLATDPLEASPVAPDPALLEEAGSYWATQQTGHPSVVNFRESVDRALRDLGYIR